LEYVFELFHQACHSAAAVGQAWFISTVFRLPAAAGVILNVIGIEIVISPGLPGFFPLYFHRISPARRGGYFNYYSPINSTFSKPNFFLS
jgi:hypothetical protein